MEARLARKVLVGELLCITARSIVALFQIPGWTCTCQDDQQVPQHPQGKGKPGILEGQGEVSCSTFYTYLDWLKFIRWVY